MSISKIKRKELVKLLSQGCPKRGLELILKIDVESVLAPKKKHTLPYGDNYITKSKIHICSKCGKGYLIKCPLCKKQTAL